MTEQETAAATEVKNLTTTSDAEIERRQREFLERQETDALRRRLEDSGLLVPGDSLKTFGDYEPQNTSQSVAADLFFDWSDSKGPRWLYAYGPVGTGKTHLTKAALFAKISRGETGLFTKFHRMLKQILAGRFEEGLEIWNRFARSRNLGIDEIGAEKTSEFSASKLSEILDDRYERGLPTLITANLSLHDLAEQMTVKLGEPTAAKRIVDRVYEMTGGEKGPGRIFIQGRSYRLR